MKLSISKKFWSSFALSLGLLAVSLTASRVSAQDCPFADDDVILYHSPSSVVEASAVPKIWDCEEGKAALDKILKKIEEEAAKNAEKADFPKEKFDYLAAKYKEEFGEDPTPRSLLKAYATHVDGVVLAFDVPDKLLSDKNADEDSFNVADAQNYVSLTYIVDFDPTEINFRKLFKEGKELVVAQEENGLFIAKLIVKDAASEDEKTVYFGTTKIKEMDEFAVVFAMTEEMVAKKLTRFQNSNEFVAKRLGDEKVYVEHIFKTNLFAGAVQAIDAKNDENAAGVKEALSKIKSFRFKALKKDDSAVIALELEAIDADSAKMFNDLALGGVAMLGLATKNKELKAEEKLGIKVLQSINFSCDANDVFARASLTLDVEQMKEFAKTFIWDKIAEKANTDDK